jgi:hypothetical protein
VGLDGLGVGLGCSHHCVARRAGLAHDVGDPGVEVVADERGEDLADLLAHRAPGAPHAGEREDVGGGHGASLPFSFD